MFWGCGGWWKIHGGFPLRSMIHWSNLARQLQPGRYRKKGWSQDTRVFFKFYFVGFLHVKCEITHREMWYKRYVQWHIQLYYVYMCKDYLRVYWYNMWGGGGSCCFGRVDRGYKSVQVWGWIAFVCKNSQCIVHIGISTLQWFGHQWFVWRWYHPSWGRISQLLSRFLA